MLLRRLLLLSQIVAFCQAGFAQDARPVARLNDLAKQVELSVFAGSENKPDITRIIGRLALSAEGELRVLGIPSQKVLCKSRQECRLFLDLILSHYDPEIGVFLFSSAKAGSSQLARIRFGTGWGWIRLKNPDDLQSLERRDVICYQEQRQAETRPADKRVPLSTLRLTAGSKKELVQKLSALDGSWSTSLLLDASGTLTLTNKSTWETDVTVLNSAADDTLFTVSLSAGSSRSIPIAAGSYRMRFEERLEGDALPSCPSNTMRVNLAFQPFSDSKQEEIFASTINHTFQLNLSQEEKTYSAIFSKIDGGRAADRKRFQTELSSPALVRLVPIVPQKWLPNLSISIDTSDENDGHWELPNPQGEYTFFAAPGDFSFEITSKDESRLPTFPNFLEQKFKLSISPFGNKTSKVFAGSTTTQQIDLGDSAPIRFDLRNTSPIDLSNVQIWIQPITLVKPATTPPLVTHPKNAKQQGWIQTVANWRAGETKHFDLGIYDERTTLTGSIAVSVEVLSLNGLSFPPGGRLVPSGGDSLHLVQVNPIPVESEQYVKQVREIVWKNCTRKHPGYGDPWQACQKIMLDEERICRKKFDPGKSDFIGCVESGLKRKARDLLTR